MKYLKFYTWLVLISVVSCQSDYYFSQIEIPKDAWTYNNSVEFIFPVEDTISTYDMHLEIDHLDSYPFQNLYMKLVTELPNDSIYYQTVSFELSDKAGYWLGTCQGPNCGIKIPIQTNIHFTQIGQYRLTLNQFTRTDSLTGIGQIALRISEAQL